MQMTFEEFKHIIREGEATGEIKTTKPLTDFDLMIQWAVGQIGDRKGYPCDITEDEIWQELFPLFKDDAQMMADSLNGCMEGGDEE